MKVTGTLVNYYFHCQRQCYLAGNRLNLEDNSELVKIGKAMHETVLTGDRTEISVENIRIDKIQGEYLIEYKKSNSDVTAAKWQVYFYLYVLKQKGIEKKGKLICNERANKSSKTMELELTTDIEFEILLLQKKIEDLVDLQGPPIAVSKPICKKCAYFSYCFI